MKIEKRYKKLTHEEAFTLLKENNWKLDNVIYTDGHYEPYELESKDSPLVGIYKGRFMSARDIPWDNCWRIEEVQVLEVGDWVRCPDGSVGKLGPVHNGRGSVTFSRTGQRDFELSVLTYVPIAKGHNPDNLTEAQVDVAEGWRLLDPEEIDTFRPGTREIQKWDSHKDSWDNTMTWGGQATEYTYRTKQPAGYFLPKPEVGPFERWWAENYRDYQEGVARAAWDAALEWKGGDRG